MHSVAGLFFRYRGVALSLTLSFAYRRKSACVKLKHFLPEMFNGVCTAGKLTG